VKKLLTILILLMAIQPIFGYESLRIYRQNSWQSQIGDISDALYTIKAKGTYFEVSLYLTISADNTTFNNSDSLEVDFYFDIPEGAAINDAWLWVGDDIIKGELLDKVTAQQIYQNIVGQRLDPLLITKNYGGQYRAQIFPIMKGMQRKIKLTYLVPASVNGEEWATKLPFRILNTSKIKLNTAKIIYYPSDNFTAPKLEGLSSIEFLQDENPTVGTFYVATYPTTYGYANTDFVLGNNFVQNSFVSTYTGAQKKNFQFIIPGKEIFNQDVGRKLLLLVHVDGFATNYYYIQEVELLMNLMRYLMEYNNDLDSIKVMVADEGITSMSTGWKSCSSANIREVIDFLDTRTYQQNIIPIESLIKTGHELMLEEAPNGEVLLLSNTDDFMNGNSVNEFLDANPELLSSDIRFNIFDFCHTYTQVQFFNNYYTNNSYFFQLLSSQTQGIFRTQRYSDESYFSDSFGSIFKNLTKSIKNWNVFVTNNSGNCYHIYPELNRNRLVATGRYLGEPPFNVQVSYTSDEVPYYIEKVIGSDSVQESDSSLYQYWASKKITELEPDSDLKYEVLDLSIASNVLSIYTAFLCLEPSLGGQICYECFDETLLPVEEEISDTLIVDNFELQAYPNPFNPSTTINVTLKEGTNPANVKFEIYNVLGQLVKSFNPEQYGNRNKYNIIWNGVDETGRKVSSGHYFFVASSLEEVKTLKLILLK